MTSPRRGEGRECMSAALRVRPVTGPRWQLEQPGCRGGRRAPHGRALRDAPSACNLAAAVASPAAAGTLAKPNGVTLVFCATTLGLVCRTAGMSRLLVTVPAIVLLAAAIPLIAGWIAATGVDVGPALALAYLAAIALAAPLAMTSRRRGGLALLPPARTWRMAVILAGLAAVPAIAWLVQAGPVSRISGQPRDWVDVLGVAALGPTAEETLFRGAIWNLSLAMSRSGGEQAGRARWTALGLSSLLFGLMHIGYWWLDGAPALSVDAVAHAGAMVAAGLIFGGVRLWSKSLSAPVVVHVVANCAILFSQASWRGAT
jgi:membrane protease YdiL (CAAX protease family)